MDFKKRESGQMMAFADLAIGVMIVVIVIALAFLVLAQFQTVNSSSFNNSTNVYTAIYQGYTNLSTLSGFVAVVVIVGVVALVITMLHVLRGPGAGGL